MELKKGFSLVELVIVIGLMGMLGLAISAIMLTTIIYTTRTRTSTRVKQAGNFALDQITFMIRNATAISSCSSSSNSLRLNTADGGNTTINLGHDGNADRVASGSAYLTPPDLETSDFTLVCEPSDTSPNVVNLAFDLTPLGGANNPVENPSLHFETSVQIRNN